MDGYKLGVVETRFAELIWQHEPLTSGELVNYANRSCNGKNPRPTQYSKNFANTVSFRTKTARSLLFSHRRAITPYRVRNLWRTPSTVPFPRFLPPLLRGNPFQRRTLRKFSA